MIARDRWPRQAFGGARQLLLGTQRSTRLVIASATTPIRPTVVAHSPFSTSSHTRFYLRSLAEKTDHGYAYMVPNQEMPKAIAVLRRLRQRQGLEKPLCLPVLMTSRMDPSMILPLWQMPRALPTPPLRLRSPSSLQPLSKSSPSAIWISMQRRAVGTRAGGIHQSITTSCQGISSNPVSREAGFSTLTRARGSGLVAGKPDCIRMAGGRAISNDVGKSKLVNNSANNKSYSSCNGMNSNLGLPRSSTGVTRTTRVQALGFSTSLKPRPKSTLGVTSLFPRPTAGVPLAPTTSVAVAMTLAPRPRLVSSAAPWVAKWGPSTGGTALIRGGTRLGHRSSFAAMHTKASRSRSSFNSRLIACIPKLISPHPTRAARCLATSAADSQTTPTQEDASTSADMDHHQQTLVQRASLRDPERYWGEFASLLHWDKPFSRVLTPDPTANPAGYTWFKDGMLNTCYNAVDRHVASGHGHQVAIYYDSPLTGEKRQITYKELWEQVQNFAGVLASHDLKKGDMVLIYMPMVPEALISMLACARLGVTHSVVFGGFAPLEVQKRINDSKPKLIVAGSCGIEVNKVVPYKEMLDKAIDMSDHKPAHRIIFQRDAGRVVLDPSRGDLDWNEEMQRIKLAGKHKNECVPVESQHPLYILYTSGTTGLPKGVVRDNGGHATQTLATMKNLFGSRPGETVFCASDVGWVVGHSFICYGPLLLGCSTVLYEGKPVGTPDAGAFFRILQDYKVSTWYTAPTALRAIRRVDPEAKHSAQYDLSTLRGLYLAGERSDTGTIDHFRKVIGGKPVIDNYWSTESGSPITGACQGLVDAHGAKIPPIAIRHGAAGMAMPGYDIRILADPAETGGRLKELGPSEFGNIVIKLPLPPSALPSLWNNEAGFKKSYLDRFPGYYDTGDAGIIDEDGYVHVMSRTDDIMQVAGHRLSTGSVEQILAEHPAISECCVVPLSDKLKGQVPMGLVVLKFGVTQSAEDIEKETIQMVRRDLGAIANYSQTHIIRRLPKTRSGKILRRTIRDIIAGKSLENQKLVVPATIEDATVLNELEETMHRLGLVGNDGEAGKVDDTVKAKL